MNKEPLYPPLQTVKDNKTWWLCEIDADKRRWPPSPWEWWPGAQMWMRPGENDTERGRTALEMSNYILIAEAVKPDWVAAEDKGHRKDW